MINFTIYSQSSGEVLWSGNCSEDEFAGVYVPEGAAKQPLKAGANDWWNGTEFAARPPQPTLHHIWQSGAWVDLRTADEVLTAAQAAKWGEIKAARETHEFGGFNWDGSTFDSDAMSQQRIQGALQLAALAGPDFVTDWTLQDNAVRALTAADLTAVGLALGQHVAASHAHARELRTAIDAAQTLGALEAITWTL